ncbi:hypothetical protein SD70_29870 [Gordoniibacillus kamchatkensis]|uniref:Uncharacterized protein n=1 Tax=Gordoniibacillus kamchatkensis TaxID=1590651 RepID=A0ABR5AA47_9BACL|nr:hypothetical protein [Paenibacillus sp. VKM B-2647]KIL37921.1 hypothetical protein SD70_29870 [Paenibacillus sp. VKM B-2647]
MIGLFIMKEQNLLTPSVAMKSAASGAAENSKHFDAKSGAAANAGGAAAKKDAGPSANASAPAADMKVMDQANAKTTPSAAAPAAAPQAQPQAGGTARTAPQSPAQEPLAQAGSGSNRGVAISSPEQSSAGSDGGQKPAAAPSAADGGTGTNPSQPVASAGSAPAPAQDKAGADASADAQPAPTPHLKGITAAPQQNGPMSTLAAPSPAPATLKSPDGKLVASVEDLKVVVRTTDTGATVMTSTYSWSQTDVISLVGFSDDGKVTYHVQHQSGADDVVLDTAAKTETKTSAAQK